MQVSARARLLLVLAFVAFISLGLPDGLLPLFVYLTLAITLLSAADYLRRIMRVPGDTSPA